MHVVLLATFPRRTWSCGPAARRFVFAGEIRPKRFAMLLFAAALRGIAVNE